MKIAFSTLGCPDFSWNDIYSMAKDLGFDGIELRGLGEEISAAKAPPFTPEHLPQTKELLRRLGLEIPCLSAGCCIKDAEHAEEALSEIAAYLNLATELSTPFIRVLADRLPEAEGEVDDAAVLAALTRLVPLAEAHGVTLLIETNGVYADTARLAKLIGQVNSDAVGALWDFHHPFRYFDEEPEKTVKHLGAYIRYVHAKDSECVDGKVRYRMMGEGDLPLDRMFRALRSVNYEGYVSLEWVKRWSSDLDDAGVVFPHFAHYMARWLDARPDVCGIDPVVRASRPSNREGLIDMTFPQLLDQLADELPEQPAFRFTEVDYSRTYREFRDDVDLFARSLIALGVRPGDHVAIWATNLPQWFITFWAATRIGAVLVTVNTMYKIHEAEYLLRQSDTHTLVMIDRCKDSDYAAIIQELCPELKTIRAGLPLHAARLPFLRNVITVGFEMPGCLRWEEALQLAERVPACEVTRRASGVRQFDVCNMQYTSGTTGFPKGVMLTHDNIINNGRAIGDRMRFSTADRLLIHVPMFHCFGMVLAMTAAMTHGSTMTPMPLFSPRLSLAAITRERITACHGVPTMFIAMLEHEDFARTDFSHMRTGIMAGSPCPIKVMRDVIEKMNMKEITIVFGQTESSPGCTQSSADDPLEVRVGTVGHPLPAVECKIVDPHTGADLPDEQDGEFVARGYNIMRGYYKMPEATAAAIDADGWLHTGDLARRDKAGNFRITGRIKDMIIRGGENIYPKEIEDFLYTHPEVRDVQVIGVPDAQYGEEIMACVIRKEGSSVTAEELQEYVRGHMARHKTPRYVRFTNEFPMNAAGKILKYRMREEAVAYLGLAAADAIETA